MRAIARKNIQHDGVLYGAGEEFEYTGSVAQLAEDEAGGLIEALRERAVPANFKTEGPTLAELRVMADNTGTKYNSRTTKAELLAALEPVIVKATLGPDGEPVVSDEEAARLEQGLAGEKTSEPGEDGV